MPQIKSIDKPDLTQTLQNLKRDILVSMNKVQIGRIESFDAETQSATIQILIKQVKELKPDGTRILQEVPALLQCPVFFLFGGGGLLTMPVASGDECIVLFNDREIDNWYVNGGSQAPTTYRVHDVSDAFALVGIKNLQTAIGDYLMSGVRLAFGGQKIDIVDGAINSLAALFLHTGNMRVTGELRAATVKADNGWTGTSDVVTVVDGIVVSG